ncbi:hypothetical protein RB6382 [Rhodopirellula baltica SH 1]|uniref:Uncharacterized protein n=1 Tax=Rhodopirellula baltica (strain DSM 10527 / NCIMB 13988 / SH1) TaxID=243090 RepID=Q7UQD8_RHOBA|nr:hypothetical protein RB6382 [Rhodopirellula baltica SH 1]
MQNGSDALLRRHRSSLAPKTHSACPSESLKPASTPQFPC